MRRLLAALLVAGMCSGLGVRTVGSADTMALAAGVAPGARPWLPLQRAVAGEGVLMPAGLAATSAVSPTWSQQAELTSTAQTSSDCFACAVALSDNTAVIGAPYTPFPSDDGAAYIFGRSGSTWSQQAALPDPGGTAGDQFGNAVATSGNTAAIAAQWSSLAAPYGGAVYLYTRSGSTWTQQARLTASDAAYNDEFGNALAMSGTTPAVAAPNKNGGRGAVYIFGRSGSTWTQQAELLYPGTAGSADFGRAVALSGDTLVVTTFRAGVAYVYGRSGTTWTRQAQLRAPPQASGQYFGIAVAAESDTALVSACCGSLHTSASVAVYTRSGSTWALQTVISPPAGATTVFGNSVALSGHTAVIGGGPTYVYVGSGSTWREQAELIPTDRPADLIGSAVAVQDNTVVSGAYGPNSAANVFVRTAG